MQYKFIQQFILEGKQDQLTQLRLPYGREDLAPAISKETLDYH